MSDDGQKFTTLVLGPSGSGKTVFMASTYMDLITSYAKTGFHFRAEQTADDQLLRENYYSLERSNSPWPEGTSAVTTYPFELIGYAGGKTMGIQSIEYLDYKGGWLLEDTPPELMNAIEKAGLTIFIIDGKQITDADETDNVSKISELLAKYSELVSRAKHGASIQFLVSKYDYAEQKTSIEKIKTILNRYPAWNNIKAACHDKKIEARLIPISSVGSGAFRFEEGKFIRNPGTPIHPMNLSIPFAFGYLQMLNDKIKKRKYEMSELEKKKMDKSLFEIFVDRIKEVSPWDILPDTPPSIKRTVDTVAPIVARILDDTILKEMKQKEVLFDHIKNNELQRLSEEENHYVQMIISMKRLAHNFDLENPECTLA